MKKFKTQWQKTPYKGIDTGDTSLTVPNQAISVREIIRRFQQGLPLEGVINKEPIFEGEEDIPDFRGMDYTDLEDYKQNIADTLKKVQEDERKQAEQKRQTEYEKAIAKGVEERLAEENGKAVED